MDCSRLIPQIGRTSLASTTRVPSRELSVLSPCLVGDSHLTPPFLSRVVATLALAFAFAMPCRAQCTSPPALTVIGAGSPGSNGIGSLVSSLPLAGHPYELKLENAFPGAPAAVLISPFVQFPWANLQFLFGASIYPVSGFAESTTVGANGEAVLLGVPQVPLSLCGSDVYVQAVFLDPGAMGSWAFTSALGLHFGKLASPVIDPVSSHTAAAQVTLRGKAIDSADTIVISGGASRVQAKVQPNLDWSIQVPLNSNQANELHVVEEFVGGGRSAPAIVQIVQDSTPPQVHIDTPFDGAVIPRTSADVVGRIDDLLSGTAGATVTVNGIAATVTPGSGTSGTFHAAGIPLNTVGGLTKVTVVTTDALGNQAQSTARWLFEAPSGPRLVVVSGDNQSAVVGTDLPQPIVVRLTDSNGTPLANEIVEFQVTRSDGLIRSTAGGVAQIFEQLLTDAQGEARVLWTLGSDAGVGTQILEVAAAEALDKLNLIATSTPGAAKRILIASVEFQLAPVLSEVGKPLEVWVSDGQNGVAGVPVTYRVIRGTASLSTSSEQNVVSTTVLTDATGHAEVRMLLGIEDDVYRVEATFPNNLEHPALFQARGLLDSPTGTAVSIYLVDDAQQPIEGAKLTFDFASGQSFNAWTTPRGVARLPSLTVSGLATVTVDSSVATTVGGIAINPNELWFPNFTTKIHVFDGVDNRLPLPIRLPRLDPVNNHIFDGTQQVELSVPELEGLRVTIPANTNVRHPDGTLVTRQNPITLSLNQVNHELLSHPVRDGAAPKIAWVILPEGVTFDPPAAIECPYFEESELGATIFVQVHDPVVDRFRGDAVARVDDEGGVAVSLPGRGVSLSGWAYATPAFPPRMQLVNTDAVVTGGRFLCTGDEIELSAVVSPAGGTYQWAVTGPAGVASISGSSTSDKVRIRAGNVPSGAEGDVVVTVTYTPLVGDPFTSLDHQMTVIQVTGLQAFGRAKKAPAHPQSNSNIDHYVWKINDGGLLLQAAITPWTQAVVDQITWNVNGTSHFNSPRLQHRLTDQAPMRYDVKFQLAGRTCHRLIAWFVWAQGRVDSYNKVYVRDIGNAMVEVGCEPRIKFDIKPASIFRIGEEIPDLTGANLSSAPLPGGRSTHWNGQPYTAGADSRWDPSSQISLAWTTSDKIVFNDLFSQLASSPQIFQLNMYRAAPISFPGNSLVGNDDASTADELTDPYTSAVLGQVTATHRVQQFFTHPGSYPAGANSSTRESQTANAIFDYRDFVRIEVSSGNWVRISDAVPWLLKIKLKQQNQKWVDNGSEGPVPGVFK